MKNLKVADIIYFCMCGQVILIELLFLISMLRIFICSVSAIFSTASRKKSTSLNKTLWFQTVLKGQIAPCNLFQFVFLCLYIVSNCPHSDFFFFLRPLGILEKNAFSHCNALFISWAIYRLNCVLKSEYLEVILSALFSFIGYHIHCDT